MSPQKPLCESTEKERGRESSLGLLLIKTPILCPINLRTHPLWPHLTIITSSEVSSPNTARFQHIRASLVAQTVKHLPTMWETRVQSLSREDLLEKGMATYSSILAPSLKKRGLKKYWRRKWQPTLVSLPRESHGQRSLIGYSPWGRKELDTTERLHFTLHFVVSSEFFLYSNGQVGGWSFDF